MSDADVGAEGGAGISAEEPCPLEFFCNEVFLSIYQWLNFRDKKAFRLLNRRLRDRSDAHEKFLFKDWVLGNLRGNARLLTPDLLIQLASQFRTMRVLTAYFGHRSGARLPLDAALVHLNTTHPELQEIKLYHATCTQAGLEAILTMENITLVEFNAFTISGDVSLGLKCSEALGILRIHNSKIASRSFSPMLSNICTNLKNLEITHTDLSLHGVGVEGGIVFPSLEAFKLVNCQISDLNLDSLLSGFRPAALKSIQLWDIGQHLLHGNDFILTSALNFPRLEMISLGFPGINDQTVISMLSNNRGLEYLRLNYFDCTLEGIGPSALDFSNLEILELAFSPHLTEAGFSGVLAKVGRKLEILRVNHTRITLEGAVAVSGPFPNLRELNISECQHISNDAFLAFLNKTGEKLEELNLSSTNITLSQIQTVTKPLPCLTELDLSFCHRVDLTGLIGLLRKTRHDADLRLDICDASLSQEVLQEYFPDIDYRY